MSKKKKILIFLAVTLLIILLFLLVWFLNKPKTPINPVVTSEGKTEQVIEPRDEGETPSVPVVETETDKIDTSLQSLATTFTERYGSYSSESDFANIYDVMDLMSASFKAKTEKSLASTKVSGEYYGVTTRVLTTTIISSDEVSSTVEISVQREESHGSPQNSEIKYQKLILTCLKEDAVWKVDSATWQ